MVWTEILSDPKFWKTRHRNFLLFSNFACISALGHTFLLTVLVRMGSCSVSFKFPYVEITSKSLFIVNTRKPRNLTIFSNVFFCKLLRSKIDIRNLSALVGIEFVICYAQNFKSLLKTWNASENFSDSAGCNILAVDCVLVQGWFSTRKPGLHI